jgi:hypothetical protein
MPIAMRVLNLTELPKIKFKLKVDTSDQQSSFGQFMPENDTILVGCLGRHPVDILRTLAHELVHYKQYKNNELDAGAGKTGSDQENEAHSTAGVIMRYFNKQYPNAIGT